MKNNWIAWTLGAALWLAAGSAAAAGEPDNPVPTWTVRGFGGAEDGAALSWTAGTAPVFTIELLQGFVPAHVFGFSLRFGSLSELSAAVRTQRTGPWIGFRLGYQLAVFDYTGDRRDVSHAIDLALMLGATSTRGHSIALELGEEEVMRSATFGSGDTHLQASGLAPRICLHAEAAMTRRIALFARLGARLGDHVLELIILPLVMAGVAVKF
jgi:hypothetical protein